MDDLIKYTPKLLHTGGIPSFIKKKVHEIAASEQQEWREQARIEFERIMIEREEKERTSEEKLQKYLEKKMEERKTRIQQQEFAKEAKRIREEKERQERIKKEAEAAEKFAYARKLRLLEEYKRKVERKKEVADAIKHVEESNSWKQKMQDAYLQHVKHEFLIAEINKCYHRHQRESAEAAAANIHKALEEYKQLQKQKLAEKVHYKAAKKSSNQQQEPRIFFRDAAGRKVETSVSKTSRLSTIPETAEKTSALNVTFTIKDARKQTDTINHRVQGPKNEAPKKAQCAPRENKRESIATQHNNRSAISQAAPRIQQERKAVNYPREKSILVDKRGDTEIFKQGKKFFIKTPANKICHVDNLTAAISLIDMNETFKNKIQKGRDLFERRMNEIAEEKTKTAVLNNMYNECVKIINKKIG